MNGITENTKYTFLMTKKEVIKAMQLLDKKELKYSSSYNLNEEEGAKLYVAYQVKNQVKELLENSNIEFE